MTAVRRLKRAVIVALMGAGAAVWYACSDRTADPLTGPSASPPFTRGPDLRVAITAQERHNDDLLRIPGVIGTAVGVLPDGRVGVQILVERSGLAGLPLAIDGIPVSQQVTGRLMAFSDPTKRQRPALLGFSVGHPSITAGTIGARVRDAAGHVYILSNNHVLAATNSATIGDPAYQPGPYDGGTAADQIATLTDFQTIVFGATTNNTMDAAIALSNTGQLDNATPIDDAYGMPNGNIYGDANGDGLFDDRNALLGLNVQKYGRTTRLTHGQITGVNGTVNVCYEAVGFVCTKSARFVDQLIITPGTFSGGGDSGSLIVTDDTNRNPVALLFAGSATLTIGNRIDLVLNRFGVSIDGAESPPPGPLTDVAVTAVSSPSAVVVGSTTSVTVTVRNFGNQNVSSGFDVTLQDATESVTVGTQSVAGLALGASATLTFNWTPGSIGSHTLVGSHTLADDKPANNQSSTTVAVNTPLTDVSVTTVSAPGSVAQGKTINVAVTVGNIGNQNVGSSFDVTLRDATDNVTLGTQTVAGLSVGANATLTFSWNTTNASLGSHSLVATHSLTDDNAANNQRSATVAVNPKLIDIALTSITGPASVNLGSTANFGVTVQNVGDQDVTASFDVVLTDATYGNTVLGTQTVNGLAIGASTSLTIPWNTTGAATAGHTLIARQMLPDGNGTNDSRAIGITVNPPANPPNDVAVFSVTAPASVGQGQSINVAVIVGNVGQQSVGGFTVTLQDVTDNVTIGTQPVSGLAVGANSTVTFSWTTTTASLGGHTLLASHNLTDDNAANNQRSATVTVHPKLTDIALTSMTGPASVTQGNTANIGVTIQNVGDLDVTASFDVVLTDASAGVTIGTQTVAGLALGVSSTLNFPWNTTGVAVSGHTLIARQMLPDGNATNDSRAIGITVNQPVNLVDVAVTSVSAPASVAQGKTINIAVTVGNVGNQNVSAGFDVILQDVTDNVTLGTQTVTGLAVGANSTLTFSWTATSASLGSHTLAASHTLSDNNAANNQRSATVTVTPKLIDVALTSISGPASVTHGNTASIGVAVQNVGEQDVSESFDVVLIDATTGLTIGTQTLAGLAISTSSNLTFSWSTAGVATGGHTLTARQMLADDNSTNDQRSATVTVNPRLMDVALTSITGPASVTQGATANIGVTVQNTGEEDVSASFDVVLTDATAGVTIGTQTVPGLALGASATLTIPWNTTGVAAGGHTLVAQQLLPDGDGTNNARAIGITVNPPVNLVTDVAVTSVTAPASVAQGQSINVAAMVGNVGQQSVGSFTVTLQDVTENVALGTQTVTGLSLGANATLTFTWTTTTASLGSHTLVATQNLTDDNAANNQGSATVTVNPKPIDIALTSLTGPASVTQGNTATIGVTVQNVGEQGVSASFSVVLTDASAGVTIGTQTVTGLALGVSATVNFPWNTTGVATGGHTLIARQMLADANPTNDSRAFGITVNPPSVHLGDLDGITGSRSNSWSATVEVTLHDANHNPVNGATVRGTWSASGANSTQCTTGGSGSNGTCRVLFSSIPKSTKSISFAVNSVTRSGYAYQSSANHDPDGSSNGTTIFVNKP